MYKKNDLLEPILQENGQICDYRRMTPCTKWLKLTFPLLLHQHSLVYIRHSHFASMGSIWRWQLDGLEPSSIAFRSKSDLSGHNEVLGGGPKSISSHSRS